jgi:low molecular weight protein-tyrosine phosphatase
MINRVLVVCVGNICRSPTAEFLLRHRLRRDGAIVESAGLAALVGNPIDPMAERVLAAHGLSAATHVARQITVEMINAADIVLAMDKRHLSAIHAQAPHARGKTFHLGKWQNDAPIPDPYGQPRAAFEHAFTLIDSAVDSWISRF